MFKGSLVALITPFKSGAVDEKRFQAFVDWQIKEGTHGVVPCGTTGKSPTLSHDEHKRVVELCVEVAKGRVPVIAGAGSNSTAEAIDFTRHAQAAGADAALVVTPYYNRPSQEGLFQHYQAIDDAVDMPIVIYNIPGALRRRHERRDHGPAGAAGRTSSASRTRPAIWGAASLRRRAIGEDFVMLSARTDRARAIMAQGGDGCISVTANVAPRACADMHEAWQKGDAARRDADQRAAGAAARRAVLRDEPGAGEIRGLAAGQVDARMCGCRWCRPVPRRRRRCVPRCAPRASQLTASMALRGDERYVAQNRRARQDYLIEDTLEAGMQLSAAK